ncbi:MAG TPA: hypothetical protein VKV20_07645 [Ktedonobacteraceae bacterium]|jgi:hypothetical protein|nr:hypothetical protein [Ktedonobacteraceae bacterium]
MPVSRYRFALHQRRITLLTAICAFLLGVFGGLAILSNVTALPAGLGAYVVFASILAVIGFVFLMPMLYFQYSYARAGLWIEPARLRVQYPGEKEQQMEWTEARFAVNEGEDYLRASKGKEGLGHLIGKTRFVRLHLEGMWPQQRAEVEQGLATHVEVRHPRLFTLMTLLNTQGELVARGRLYLFENHLLCTENRGEKRVFFYAPLKDLRSVKQRASFYVGKLECEAFNLQYKDNTYVIMLGYETTISNTLGSSSHWSVTGSASEWVEALLSI